MYTWCGLIDFHKNKYALLLKILFFAALFFGKTASAQTTAPDSMESQIPSANPFALATATVTTLPEELVPLFLSVNLNQQSLEQIALFIRSNDGQLWVSSDDLIKWRFHPPKGTAISYQNKLYYSLNSYPGLTYQVDYQHTSIEINTPASFLQTTQTNALSARDSFITPSPWGCFLNYDVSVANANQILQPNYAGGVFESGFFNNYGVAVGQFLTSKTPNESNFIRLQTSWTQDFPEKMSTLRLGDAISTPGMWGSSVLFGGLQWGTNFSTQPNFSRISLPTVEGEAVLPSTLDLYINNALLLQQQVPPGPFGINNIPVASGSGNINVVRTDLLGRQQIISIPYYSNINLLKPGLHDYAVELGFIRKKFSIDSNDYGRPVLMGTDSFGLTRHLTVQWHAELLPDQQAIGAGGYIQVYNFGIMNMALAASHASEGRSKGLLAAIGFQHQNSNGISFGANLQTKTSEYTQINLPSGQLRPNMQTQFFLGAPIGDGSIGFTYTTQQPFNGFNKTALQRQTKLFGANYSRTFFHTWSVQLSALTEKTPGTPMNKAFLLSVTRAFGDRTTFSSNATRQTQERTVGNVQLYQALPTSTGFGYNLQANLGQQQNQNYQASVSGQTNSGTYVASVGQVQGERSYRFETYGGMVAMDKHLYFSHQVNNSFAVVQVPDYANVRVYAYNQLIAKTDKHGNALIPNLIPYENNPIRIEPNDLPLSAEISTNEFNPVPRYRSGVIVRFPAKSAHGALLKLVDPEGTVLPLGASVTINDHTEKFPVAEVGQVYITGLTYGMNTLQVSWEDKHCVAAIHYQRSEEIIPDFGTVVCK